MKSIFKSLKFFGAVLLFFCLANVRAYSQAEIERIEPTFWWTAMKNHELQLLVHGKDIGKTKVSFTYPGVKLERQQNVENPNYTFVYLTISDRAKPGSFELTFSNGKEVLHRIYQLRARNLEKDRNQGFDRSDVIYLLMPDRFANGNPENDYAAGMLERPDRQNPNGRHGGDFKGIEDHLGYFKNLGVTALWMTPVFEADMPASYHGYHGYASTDMYRADRRFGTNEEFLKLVNEAHRDSLKVIMDMIHNHIGSSHWWMSDLPAPDWVHSLKKNGNTNYRAETVSDPYASDYDRNKMTDGWFVKDMPDLNQKNPLLATYLIQNTIWWVEYSGVDGIRMDTYPYPDKTYMAHWVQAVLREFPRLNVVGEAWVPEIPAEAWWQKDFPLGGGYNSHLPSVTDFPLHYAMVSAFSTPFGWDTGLSRLYLTLTQDFMYHDPNKNVIFLDNHDLERFASSIGDDPGDYRMAIAFLLTTRGIPQIYYGTELMMTGTKQGSDGNVRQDFPGGWPGDPHNAFTRSGRTLRQNVIFDYTQTLLHWRKGNKVISNGKLMQFIPENNLYVYFRYTDRQCVMVALNGAGHDQTFSTDRYQERMNGYHSAVDVISGEKITDLNELSVPAKSALVLELRK
ncbi:MAG TPA: glycoside hydrolase family 13 protein [Balneolales bacterium]|nr:glycoside hydrolase family 13 protein [Balneolales bacterium]